MAFNGYYWVVYPDKEERLFLTGDYEIKFLEDEKKSWFINILYKKDNNFEVESRNLLMTLSNYIHALNRVLHKEAFFEDVIYKKTLEFQDKKIIVNGPFKHIGEKFITLIQSKTNNDFIFPDEEIETFPDIIKLYDPVEYLNENNKMFSDNIYIFKITDKNNKSLVSFGLYR